MVSKIVAAIKLALEIGVMLVRLALTFRDPPSVIQIRFSVGAAPARTAEFSIADISSTFLADRRSAFLRFSICCWEIIRIRVKAARFVSPKDVLSRDLVVAAEEFAGQGSGANAVLERDLAVHDRVAIAVRLLHTPPVAVREIVYRLHRLYC